jgi:uncharacterized protein (UPF0262 family)
MPGKERNRLTAVDLDESIGMGLTADAEHERRIAIYDLIEDGRFAIVGQDAGPYRLMLSAADNRILFDIHDAREERIALIGLSMSPFRRIVKDYFLICESYFKAIRQASPSQIETIDMARRAVHNEGSQLLTERLAGKIETDTQTARRLFTLLCVLHWRG